MYMYNMMKPALLIYMYSAKHFDGLPVFVSTEAVYSDDQLFYNCSNPYELYRVVQKSGTTFNESYISIRAA